MCRLLLSLTLAAGLAAPLSAAPPASPERPPNIVIIMADDLGYGDLGCYGHPTIQTPHLDRMAREGQRWTDFYVAASVCTPSRAGLLTGRLPVRSGMCSARRRVLFPDSAGGIPTSEITLAEALKDAGYTTACVGKWHLGHLPQFLPTANGFDHYFGIPYSNDMDRVAGGEDGRETIMNPQSEFFNVPLMRDAAVIERPADQSTLTRRYTDEAVQFIQANRDRPFFLYMPHTMPHVPLFRSEQFVATSQRGLYGDVVQEIDASVGRVLDTIRAANLAENTFVFFTSDNGPWLVFDQQGGSAGLLREGKGCTFEGGMREPFLAWAPQRIPAGQVVRDLGCTMDLYTTAIALAGATLPQDRVVDGLDLSEPLHGSGPSPREIVYYYRGTTLYALRRGPYKIHFMTQPSYGPGSNQPTRQDPPLLYHLGQDPGEQYDVAARNREIVAQLSRVAAEHALTVVPVPNQLELRLSAPSR